MPNGCYSFHIRYCLRIGWWAECEWYFTVMVAMIKECYRVVDLLTRYNSQNLLLSRLKYHVGSKNWPTVSC